MIIAISSEGKDLDSNVDPRFGRAKYFIIYDTVTTNFDVINNVQNLQAAQGAGIQAAQNVANQNTELVISGNLGPKAYTTLQAAGIKTALWSQGTVKEAVELAKSGKLQYAKGANVEGHWT
ncbi:MAG: dinitrogenase iron-molybdenum cofactor biosynthesis protein [candidate division Zixibacteria bacterium]|nr:dinitrogenase iron-molybdenum cofactor biosynthesis protein [candidate division Zixibacteria bacterium]